MKILKTLLIVPLAALLSMPVYASRDDNDSRSESHQERYDSRNDGKQGRYERKKQDSNLHKASHKTYKHKHYKHKRHVNHGRYYGHDHGHHYGEYKKHYRNHGHTHGYGRYGYGNRLYDNDGWSLILRLSDDF